MPDPKHSTPDTPTVGKIEHPFKARDEFFPDRNGSPFTGEDGNQGGLIPPTPATTGKQPMQHIEHPVFDD